jgi:virulence-associated protein VapD
MANMDRASEQRRFGYGGYTDLCRYSSRHGFYFQQGNAIYLQFVILTGERCNE